MINKRSITLITQVEQPAKINRPAISRIVESIAEDGRIVRTKQIVRKAEVLDDVQTVEAEVEKTVFDYRCDKCSYSSTSLDSEEEAQINEKEHLQRVKKGGYHGKQGEEIKAAHG